MTGKILFYNRIRSFGFIKGDDGKEYFYAKRDAQCKEKYLYTDNRVTFDPAEDMGRKPRAENVVPNMERDHLWHSMNSLPTRDGWYQVIIGEHQIATPALYKDGRWETIFDEWVFVEPLMWSDIYLARKEKHEENLL